jgi:hypothetical protein
VHQWLDDVMVFDNRAGMGHLVERGRDISVMSVIGDTGTLCILGLIPCAWALDMSLDLFP